MGNLNTTALGATIAVGVGIAVCVLALIIFVLIFLRIRIKNDSNIRKRLITNNAFAEKVDNRADYLPSVTEVVEPPPPVVIPIPPPPAPVVVPPPPPPPPVILPTPPPPPALLPPVPAPQPPPQPVIIREIIRENPQPETRVVRRSSWSGDRDNDWVLVKKIKKRSGKKVRHNSGSSSSSSSSSDDEDDRKQRMPRGMMMPQMQMVYGPRLAPYDLATPIYNVPRPLTVQPMQAFQTASLPTAGQPTAVFMMPSRM